MHCLIVIAVAGRPRAIDRLIERVDGLVVEATQAGGIDGLTTEVIEGVGADAAREALRATQPAKRGRTRKGVT